MSGAALAVAAFRKKSEKKADAVFRQVCMEMAARIIRRSPVDTGRFKGNWNAAIDSADTSTNQSFDSSGSLASSKAKAVSYRLKNGNAFFFTNNLPYAYRLEYEGHSKQAPAGMVRVTVAEFQQVVNAQVQAVRNGN